MGRDVVDEDLANAARIVACVNACAGMADPASEISALKAQRDELLAACKAALGACGLHPFVRAEIDEVVPTLRSAIAKAEGGAH